MSHEPECERWYVGTADPDECGFCEVIRAAYARGRADEQDRSLVNAIFHAPDDGPRSFALVRTVDVSGVSGTGTVAYGVEFPDGTVALRWVGANPTSVVFHDNGMESVQKIHGHGGATRVMWLSEDLGPRAAEMDECEARGYARGRADERERKDTPIQGEHDPLCFPAIRDVRVGDWGPSCFTCEVIAIARQQATEAAVQRVEALERWQDMGINGMEEDPDGWAIDRADALAAIRGEGA